MLIDVVGSIAGALTTAAFIPQALKVYKTKHTKDLSLVMLAVFSLGVILWLYYGVLLVALPVIIANIITLFLSLYILGMKIRHG